MIDQKYITKYQHLYQEHFGKTISIEEARDSCTKLLNLLKLIYKPMTKAEFEQVQLRRMELS